MKKFKASFKQWQTDKKVYLIGTAPLDNYMRKGELSVEDFGDGVVGFHVYYYGCHGTMGNYIVQYADHFCVDTENGSCSGTLSACEKFLYSYVKSQNNA